MTKRHGISCILAALYISLIVVWICSTVSSGWSEQYEGYYLYLGDHPQDADSGWHEDAQGITHDNDNWYITQAIDNTDWRCKIGLGLPSHQGILWKIPVSQDLNSVSADDPGVIRNVSWNVPPLNDQGYWHFGAPCHYKYGGIGYILIPTGYPSILAVFKAQDLSYVGYSIYPEPMSHEIIDPGWCAVDSDNIYVSGDSPSQYYKYYLDGSLLSEGKVELKYLDSIPFLDFNGNQITLDHMQGGVISESGRLFYISSGYYDQDYQYAGISVFDRQTNQMVAHSSNGQLTNGYFPFNYAYTPGGTYNEEPEGLTIWDLDSKPVGSTGNAYGRLHVILVDNDCASADEVYLMHYTNTITVDASYGNVGNGKPNSPFTSIQEAQKWINCIHWRNCPRYCPWDEFNIPHTDNLPQGIWCRYNNTDPDNPNTFIIECFDGQGNPWYPDLAACGLCNHPWDVPNPAECIGWDGARIKIRAGTYPESYPEPLIFDKQIQLFADGGTARIRSRVALSPSGTINIGKSGVLKIY